MQVIEEIDNIGSLIHIIRGQQVMLDEDLAMLYGYDKKALNQQATRNKRRFPPDFMFKLSKEEWTALKSQIVTLNDSTPGRGKHSKYPPTAYTEQGIYMLATVLRGELAEGQSVKIMRAFRAMRHYIAQNHQFVTKAELQIISDRQGKTEEEIVEIHNRLDEISENFISEEKLVNHVIYKGQKFEADMAYIDIFKRAKKSIFYIDDYVDIKTLHLLSHKKKNVEIILFTENGHGKEGFLTASEIKDFNEEYPTRRIKPNQDCHDRFIIIDYGLKTEQAYHCGTSSKDAGNKVCAINKMKTPEMVHPFIDKMLKKKDRTI
ncbi:MAG: ORF6N domain-containing protein [Lachnospiraceae bacterium]|nr:ORF6N domain-containing protein [Lachnospiraceae bacterium]